MARSVYVASSWRNEYQPLVVALLRMAGLSVYDFRHPAPGESGFAWREIDPEWETWSPEKFRKALDHTTARHGFTRDMNALRACDACLLVLPCGRSAHLELGWAAGAGKRTAVYIPKQQEPELMYLAAGTLLVSADELSRWATSVVESEVR